MNKLEQLATMSEVVADTGDIAAIEKYRPVDATTNPSLLLQAARLPKYTSLIDDVVDGVRGRTGNSDDAVRDGSEKFAVAIGLEILKLIPGRVSTEVDARLSFDSAASVASARRLIALYEDQGIGRDRILIKLAATWEGIRACRLLEQEGVNCNVTLVFSPVQAIAAAEAGAFLISPFVGRILDWYKKAEGKSSYTPDKNPGVQSVRKIYSCFKERGYSTVVMGASFRSAGEIEALAGCDRLTIAPKFLEELSADEGELPNSIRAGNAPFQIEGVFEDEAEFRYALNSDAMATEKLAEGIRGFVADQNLLEDLLRQKLGLQAA